MSESPELKQCPPCPFCEATAVPFDGYVRIDHRKGCFFTFKQLGTTWIGKRAISAWSRRAPITEQPVVQEAQCGFCLTYPGECPEHTTDRNADTSPTRIALSVNKPVVGEALQALTLLDSDLPHNPDNLTPEQYGASEGWRLLTKAEHKPINSSIPACEYWSVSGDWKCHNDGLCITGGEALRTKLSSDEFAALRGQQ